MSEVRRYRCAIYTRKSCEDGLEQDFNSLHAQRESAANYIKSQSSEGWEIIPIHYDDGGYSGGNTNRPALKNLLSDIEKQRIDIVVVYKVDRLSRSLTDFSKLIEVFDKHKTSFVSVTQQFNTTNSMGRLTLNMLLSFAQFEREVTSERIRDKIAASKKKGIWMGGNVPLGYKVKDRKLITNPEEKKIVQSIYQDYSTGSYTVEQITDKYSNKNNKLTKGKVSHILKNPYYIGKVPFKGNLYNGEHKAIITQALYDKVQDILSSRNHKTDSNSLKHSDYTLRNKLHSIDNKPYTISTSTKDLKNNVKQKIRYYINPTNSNKKLKYINAENIEKLVKNLVSNSAQQLTKQISKYYTDTPESVLYEAVDKTTKATGLDKLINNIYISSDKLICQVDAAALSKTLDIPNNAVIDEGKTINLENEMSLDEVKGGRKQIILAASQSYKTEYRKKPDVVLLRQLKQAFRWHRDLVKQKYKSVADIATKYKMDRANVNAILRMRLLSPTTIEQIMSGTQPITLTADLLKRAFPINWPEQHKYFGITA